jgi:hypothetical protein
MIFLQYKFCERKYIYDNILFFNYCFGWIGEEIHEGII